MQKQMIGLSAQRRRSRRRTAGINKPKARRGERIVDNREEKRLFDKMHEYAEQHGICTTLRR